METLETPEFVYFDLGKVLVDFSHDVMCAQMAEKVGLSPERLRELVFESGLSDQYEDGQLNSAEFCEAIFENSPSRCEPEELLLAGSDIFTAKSDMLPLISSLAVSGTRIGILSNTCPAHWEFVAPRYAFLTDMFSEVVLSYEVRARKPGNSIYEIAAKQAGVSAQKVFFVDDREDNVQGAIDAGFDAHVFTSSRQVQKLLIERGIRFNF
jgi:putative hydrolase of the HAD superfamily